MSTFFAFLKSAGLVNRNPIPIRGHRAGRGRLLEVICSETEGKSQGAGQLAADASDRQFDSTSATIAPEASSQAKGDEDGRLNRRPLRTENRVDARAQPDRTNGKPPRISVVLRDIVRCEKTLVNSGLRHVISVDIHNDQRFYIGISWTVDPYSGKWRVMHENTWDVQVLAPESGDYVWTRKSEVRPLKESSPFQQVNAHAYLDALLMKASGAMTKLV